MYGTQPMGIEMQATFWAYAQTGALGNMFFRKYIIINKTDVLGTNRTFDSMFVSMWSDPDVGDAGDDFAGCDTALSMTFAYNGSPTDATYGTLPPPAVGFDFFQGPLVDGVAGQDLNKNGVDDAVDFGISKGRQVGPGKINLPMTAAYYYINDDPTLTDPVQGSYTEGAVRWFRFMQGRIGLTDQPFIDPLSGLPSKFTLPGDPVNPVAGVDWVDGLQFAPGDRRIGAASGPFTMAPGDTQEVVVAEIVAGAIPGMDFKSAITLMKFYDLAAQNAYDNFFNLPTPPPRPTVKVIELDEKIVLDWGSDMTKVNATELFDNKGYQFQGYNVYQLPSASADVSEGRRLATFDVIDEVKRIIELDFNPNTAVILPTVKQFGTDSGIKRYLEIISDELSGGSPLINGIRYYFAVTAYSYTADVTKTPTSVENPLQILTVIPNSNNPGVTLGEGVGSSLTIEHEGTADGGPVVTVVDPTATTGQNYEMSFFTQEQIRNEEGNWVPSATVMRDFNPNDPDTLTGTTIDIAAVYAGDGINIDLGFYLDVVHHYYGWVDGVTLNFPAGTMIVDVPPFSASGGDPEIVIQDNGGANPTVLLGITDNSQTQGGVFHEGGETWNVVVDPTTYTLPLSVNWEAHDDGYAGGQNETGTTIVSEIGFAARTARLWQLQNVSTGVMVLENQSVVAGVDLYPRRDDIVTNLGLDAAPIVDGVQINLAVNYDAPSTFFYAGLNGEPLPTINGTAGVIGTRWESESWQITDYGWFGFPTGTSFDKNGYGSQSVDDLQQDYEFRWTGVEVLEDIGGQQVYVTQEGTGSIATFYGSRLYDMGDHPLNPNPGSTDPFLARIPFEVWNKNADPDPQQVNYQFYDRNQDDPAANEFKVWNTDGRMYSEILNTPYDSTQIANGELGGDDSDFYTWMQVWYRSQWTTGDVIELDYVNPIQFGVDKYKFKTTEPTYSSELAKNQVNEINVFPNPYYGINTEELNKYNRFVIFNHLPEKAKIRIFNLAGVLVRSLDKDDTDQFFRWDLANEDGLPVASGLYIAYIELPELGTTKILKLAIVQEQQVLDRF
ncbi:MAG: T9SS type A sorting domain-containing protein [Ignavibacteria bacterium]|nr:T9SS type A sorting domain-containing protein [Ignavibacteria bacterium]